MSGKKKSHINFKNTGDGREPRTRSEKSTIEYHDEKVKKLEADLTKLQHAKDQGMFAEDDEKQMSSIRAELEKYNSAMTQVNINTATRPESSAAAGQQAAQQNATEQNAAEQNATMQDATEQNATMQNASGQDATMQNATANAPNPGTTHANAQKSPSQKGEIKREHAEESKMPTQRLVDDLGMAWDVDVNNTCVDPSLQGQEKSAIGHIMRTSQACFCVTYGSKARSARFESSLPHGSQYQGSRDVTKGSNRIVEKIVNFHKGNKEPLPMDILSKVHILLVYWDSKMGVGHAAEVDVLAPNYGKKRPHTRCFIYLDPELYKTYDLENKTGYSHETRSIMKPLQEGNDDWQKSIAFHNIAVRLENKFEKECMVGVPGRPGPLRELVQERKVVSSRSRSRYATAEPSESMSRYATAEPSEGWSRQATVAPSEGWSRQATVAPSEGWSRQATVAPSTTGSHFDIPPTSPRQPTDLPRTRHKQTPTTVKTGTSLKQRFHMEFLELFDLADNVTYADLTEKQQLLYPAQFTKWKAVNS
ncbi:hypothetical protein PtrM4_118780 [Pyrenophora tritici-repentis]|uniref:Uncharacterized protein n=1 Tax=Pyrenophora tritici-repentis TaxID=45151 RepID=A0A834RSW4_9PLEO|nr:hypothetical protein PtrM4_118780 [Pyrenophora tritici-repentis]